MRNIILYIATSLDGYLAREDGALDWLPQPTEDDMGYADFYDTIDTVVIGRTTYEQITQELSPDVWAYEGKTSYVATSKTLTPDPNVSFINGDIATFISNLKNAPGKDIWLVGGGKLIDAFVRANLIDKYIITIIPFNSTPTSSFSISLEYAIPNFIMIKISFSCYCPIYSLGSCSR